MYDLKDRDVVSTIHSRDEKKIVLTFDDGPSKWLEKIINILNRENVKAMFFWQSRLLYKDRPWKKVIESGHVVGSHSVNHPNLIKLSYDEQWRQLEKSKQQIEEITGESVVYFRPPFGQYNEQTKEIAKKLGLTIVMWEIASFDWELKNEPNKIIDNITRHVKPGSIILLHELKQTVEILPSLLKAIKKKGYQFEVL